MSPVAARLPLVALSLFGLALLSQLAWRIFYWNDDKYWMLTLLSLAVCYGFVAALAPARPWGRIQEWLGLGKGAKERPADAGAVT